MNVCVCVRVCVCACVCVCYDKCFEMPATVVANVTVCSLHARALVAFPFAFAFFVKEPSFRYLNFDFMESNSAYKSDVITEQNTNRNIVVVFIKIYCKKV